MSLQSTDIGSRYTYRVSTYEDDRHGELIHADSHASAALKYAEQECSHDPFDEIELFVAQVTGLGYGTLVRFVVTVEVVSEFSISEKSEVVR